MSWFSTLNKIKLMLHFKNNYILHQFNRLSFYIASILPELIKFNTSIETGK